ncbi:MAG: hypothetical protein HY862_15755 [Chloroflexi bacterium]|nr:hypothetical protein [Chloroflexota bacterium]
MSDHSSSPSLMILFTAYLRANFELMPHVSAMIQRMRSALVAENPRPILILDLGGAWNEESWECQVTENRAPYLVLDAMSYAAVNADGLAVEDIMGMQETVQMRLLENTMPARWKWRDMTVYLGPHAAAPAVTWALDDPPFDGAIGVTENGCLRLYPQTGALGFVEAAWPSLEIIQAKTIPLSWDIRPDPSIVACVEFVQREAKSYAERNSRSQNQEEADE